MCSTLRPTNPRLQFSPASHPTWRLSPAPRSIRSLYSFSLLARGSQDVMRATCTGKGERVGCFDDDTNSLVGGTWPVHHHHCKGSATRTR